jgi:hypothetical protein
MKEYLKNILPRLKTYSQELDIAERIIDKPWIWVSEEIPAQKLVFRRNGELLMVQQGEVTIGRWEYIQALNSLLIDRNVDKILMNYAFIDDAVMLLKKDGIENGDIIAFVNENRIPNLNYRSYLEELDKSHTSKPIKINSVSNSLSNSVEQTVVKTDFWISNFKTDLSVYIYCDWETNPERAWIFNGIINRKVQIHFGDELLDDGYYKIPDHVFNKIPFGERLTPKMYFVKDGYIKGEFSCKLLKSSDYTFDLYKSDPHAFKKKHSEYEDAAVFYSNSFRHLKDGKYKFSFMCYLTVKDGRVIRETAF